MQCLNKYMTIINVVMCTCICKILAALYVHLSPPNLSKHRLENAPVIYERARMTGFTSPLYKEKNSNAGKRFAFSSLSFQITAIHMYLHLIQRLKIYVNLCAKLLNAN